MDEFNKKFLAVNPAMDYVRFLAAKIDADNDRVALTAVYDKSREGEYDAAREKVRVAASAMFPPFASVRIPP